MNLEKVREDKKKKANDNNLFYHTTKLFQRANN